MLLVLGNWGLLLLEETRQTSSLPCFPMPTNSCTPIRAACLLLLQYWRALKAAERHGSLQASVVLDPPRAVQIALLSMLCSSVPSPGARATAQRVLQWPEVCGWQGLFASILQANAGLKNATRAALLLLVHLHELPGALGQPCCEGLSGALEEVFLREKDLPAAMITLGELGGLQSTSTVIEACLELGAQRSASLVWTAASGAEASAQ